MELFGFTVGRNIDKKIQDKDPENLPSIVGNEEDGAIEVAAGGFHGSFVDLEGKAKNEGQLVTKYRTMAIQPEADSAITDIVNEAIIIDEHESPIQINLDETELPKAVKNKIKEEFDRILKLLNFQNQGYEIFRKWYVDGRLYYHLVIDPDNAEGGIKNIRYIDPRKIRKIREPIRQKDARTGAVLYKGSNEYYLYNPGGISKSGSSNAGSVQGIKIAKDSVTFVHSGLMDPRNHLVFSWLHKAIKPLNQLRMLEDAVVIYRLSRAPERRIFYIDVGNLPKMKAEQALREMMTRHKNKLVYDANTGEVRDDKRYMNMMEDFWFPRREGGRGTEVTTLPAGQNLGEMDDVEFFKRKLYKSLNVPISRMESENNFSIGRSSEITRDEIKFSKFIKRIRARFSILFDEMLEIQLSLKGITTRKEWKEISESVYYDFTEDNHFSELKESEIMTERLRLLGEVDAFVGKYFSEEWVRKSVLRFSEDEIKDLEKQMKKEGSDEDFEEDKEAKRAQAEPQEPAPVPVTIAKTPEQNPAKKQSQEKDPEDKKAQQPKKEETELGPEEKKLVESMTKFMDSMVDDED